MTHVTQCQTQHKIPVNRETASAAVPAAVETVIPIKTKDTTTAAVATATAVKAAIRAKTAIRVVPKSSARKARDPRGPTLQPN